MLKVAALQYCASDDVIKTLQHIKPLIAEAASHSRLITLPECASYLASSHEQLQQKAEWDDDSFSQKWFAQASQQFGVWLLAGSLMIRKRDSNQLVNRSVLFGPSGKVIASYDKIHMFDAKLGDGKNYNESANFTAGHSPVVVNIDNIPTGMSVCYDLRFPHLYRQLALDGAQILLIPSAFTALSGKAHWHVLLRARAIETGCYVIAPAQQGIHTDGRQTYGHSMIINPWGEIIAEAKDGDSIISAEFNPDSVAKARQSIPSLITNPIINQTRVIN